MSQLVSLWNRKGRRKEGRIRECVQRKERRMKSNVQIHVMAHLFLRLHRLNKYTIQQGYTILYQAALFKSMEKQVDFLLILSNFNSGKNLQKCRYVKSWTAPSPTFWLIHLIHFSCSKSTVVWLLNSPVNFSSWLQIKRSWSRIQQGKETFFISNSFTMLRKRRRKKNTLMALNIKHVLEFQLFFYLLYLAISGTT